MVHGKKTWCRATASAGACYPKSKMLFPGTPASVGVPRLNHSPASKQEVLVAITEALATLSLGVAASRASPGSQPGLVDLRAADPLRLGRTRAPKEDGIGRPRCRVGFG